MNSVNSRRPLVVAHYTGTFLPLTEGWIYDQIRWCRNSRAIALARRTTNLDQFPWQPIFSISDSSPVVRLVTEFQKATTGRPSVYIDACRKQGVNIVHAHFGERGLAALALARALDVPLVTSFYGRDMTRHHRGVAALRRKYERLFREGTLFIAEGPAAKQRLITIGCPEEKIRIHRLGIDPDRVPFRKRDFTSDRFGVLMAARFVEKKGLGYGLEAFCRVAATNPGMHLTIVGDAHHNAAERTIRSELQQIVSSHQMESRVRFSGFIPREEFFDLLVDHHIFLQPSVTASDGDSEGGHPVALTQAAASGLPIIATRHDDIPEVAVDGVNGWLVAERDVEQLVAALEEALHDRARLLAFSEASRRVVEDRYDGRRHTLDTFYAEAVEAVAGRRQATRPKLSVLVTTFNERDVILDCLASVSWAEEIYVVDSFSTDGTVDHIRSHFPQARIEQRKYQNAAEQKNYAIPRLAHDWVLVIDADERVTPELRREIEKTLAGPKCIAYSIARRNFVLGKRVRWSGLQRDRVTRLFDRNWCRYPDRLVHADLAATGPVGRIHSAYDHLYIRSLDHAIEKLMRYARWGGQQLYQSGRRVSAWEILFRPAWRFLRDYVINLGVLEGSRGLVVVLLHTAYTTLKYLKLWELQHGEPQTERPRTPTLIDAPMSGPMDQSAVSRRAVLASSSDTSGQRAAILDEGRRPASRAQSATTV